MTASAALAAFGGAALPAATAVPLDAARAIETAVRTHPSVAARRAALEASRAQTGAAWRQFFPALSVSADRHEGENVTVARLTQPLWTGGRLTAGLDSARLREARAREELESARLELALRVAGLYQNFLVQSERHDALDRGIARLDDLAGMIGRRVEAGVSARTDGELAASRLSQARSDLALAVAARELALAQLAQAVGRPLAVADLDRSAAGPDAQAPARGPSDNLSDLLERALATNPDARIAEVDARLAETDIASARAALWPELSVRAERQRGEYPGSLAEGNRVYVTLQMAPGAGLSAFSLVAAARERLRAAEEAALAARRNATERVHGEWAVSASAHARIADLAHTRAASASVLASWTRLFVTGRRSWLDLLNSVRELMQVEQQESEARAQAAMADLRLRLLAGERPWNKEEADE